MIKIAICDDNTAMKNKLDGIISAAFSEYTDDFLVKSFSNGILLMNEQKIEPFDVIFWILICQKCRDLMLLNC